jgi:hypothetical protein
MPLTAPQSLTAGTQYWLGFMMDTSVQMQGADSLTSGRSNSITSFSGGAPSTAPVLSVTASVLLWGNITLTAPVNYYEVNQQPPAGTNSYVYDSTVNHEDLYNFPTLSVVPLNVYAVAVKGYAMKSDSGTRTVSLRAKSGATDSGGSLTSQVLGTSFQWYGSFFPTDPNTGAAWTGAALNLATSGFRVDS